MGITFTDLERLTYETVREITSFVEEYKGIKVSLEDETELDALIFRILKKSFPLADLEEIVNVPPEDKIA